MLQKRPGKSPFDQYLVKLVGHKLMLKNYSYVDISALHTIFADRETMQYHPRIFSARETENWVVKNFQRYHQLHIGQMGVFLTDSAKLIGDAGIRQTIINEHWENQLDITIAKPYWRRGYGREVADMLLMMANEVKLKQVVCHMPTNHHAAIHLVDVLGFTREACYINHRHQNTEYFIYRKNFCAK